MLGKRVKFLRVFDLAPYSVYDMVGEIGIATKCVVTRKGDRSWNVWRVQFEDITIWIKEKDLKVVND